ncbi:actin interacting protein 3-domain-containing protein [Suillus paluster]|uniref:actin interacting protein 3-domain-containing protein n=1 Tax=Suillus paluster TaxID=48578 RepID=UPI001B86BC6B|nr:actin interacting protein 3-domain-containing protein [Suillus paluster]KAG1728172.1 actin interacting protein 3-domain-containing protein [Suillus paluster]
MSSTRSTPPPPYTGHSSRRDNQSVASIQSSGSSSSRSSRSHAHPAVESAVTRLLVAIKQLLESLTQWSTGKMDEAQVSDVYVRLGNDFNAAVAAFAAFNIDMSDLMSVPEDLREVLETCLAEEATADNLNVYLPTVRKIITNLLQGLRGKQSMYRRIVSEHQSRHRSSHSRTDSRSSKSDKASRRDEDSRHRSQLSRSVVEEEDGGERDSIARRSARSSARRQDPRTETPPPPSPPPVFREPDDEIPPNEKTITSGVNGHANRGSGPPQARQSQRVYKSNGDALSRESSETLVASSIASTPSHAPPNEPDKNLPQTPPQSVPVPASVKRYSLVDRPVSSSPKSPPAVLIDEAPAPPSESPSPSQTPPIDSLQAPAVASSLAALKKSDVLERRASKRFSTYNITKMTGSRERSSNRRSMAVGSLLTPGDLAVLTEVDEPDVNRSGSGRRMFQRTPSPTVEAEAAPPVPPLPPLPESARSQRARTVSKVEKGTDESTIFEQVPEPALPTTFSVFLQLGREVKKVTIEPGLSFSSLRMLFVDKFSYNPGLENFPAIYIRDPSSGVQYELEDIEEVKEKCLLSLNIEPLDQIKQHIDSQISTLSNDLKELRTAISNNRRSSHINPIIGHDFVESTPMADRPSERQLHNVARRLSRIVGDVSSSGNPFILPQITGQSLQLQPQTTGASVMSEYSNRVVNDLKTQFDEVQNLRRDLGIMRQLYTEFMKSTKDSLGALRTQTQSVKQLASVKVGGARGFIDQGKTKLDTRSQNVLTKVEELQDTVEALRDDVLKRHMSPKPQLVKQIQEDIASTATELASLKEHIDTVKPMWKKTWEEELQNIVEEQGFLGHQEEFMNDLLEDHKALVDVFGHVEKVISIRGTTPGRSNRGRGFKPLPADEGHTGLSTVMMEIRGAAVDPERRMKAIEANQKNREREIASRSDEFQEELTGFVGGKRLRMTGGAEEVDRVRQRRNELALKAMFNSASASVDNLSGFPTSPSAG